ncbi:MAG: acyl-CoA thioesterase [Rhodospirillales bacterium]|nr:acyl-CoA thioesterase [Rhodospirillales bacterium]
MNSSEMTPPRDPAIRMIAMPADANPSGDIFGGYIMSLMDMAGANVCYERAGGRIATVAVKEIEFHVPVLIGDEITCYADITRTGRTSITARVETWVKRRAGGDRFIVTEGEFTYLRIDENRNPIPMETPA